MRSYISSLLISVVGLAGIGLAVEVVFFDMPIYIGRLSPASLDPIRAEYLKVPTVTAPELLAKLLLVVACFAYVVASNKNKRGFSKREASFEA